MWNCFGAANEMAKVIYFTPTSLDGYIGDETIGFDWSAPDEEGMAFITGVQRSIGTFPIVLT